MDGGGASIPAFLDLSETFDTTDHSIILDIMVLSAFIQHCHNFKQSLNKSRATCTLQPNSEIMSILSFFAIVLILRSSERESSEGGINI